jgi:uncharacterized protein
LAEVPTVAYVDSSALIKLVVAEPESDALHSALAAWERHAASAIVRTEVVRAAARVDSTVVNRARRVVDALTLIRVDEDILDRAARLPPATLRTLDAIHLASALALGEALGSVVTYDVRLGEAAREAGLDVVAPR